MRCSKIASVKVSEITDLVSKALENDKAARYLAQQQASPASLRHRIIAD